MLYIADMIGGKSFCPFGYAAVWGLQSNLAKFRPEFDAAIAAATEQPVIPVRPIYRPDTGVPSGVTEPSLPLEEKYNAADGEASNAVTSLCVGSHRVNGSGDRHLESRITQRHRDTGVLYRSVLAPLCLRAVVLAVEQLRFSMPDLVNVTIDDIKVAVPAGTLVVDAAKAAGIEIPVFCSHPKLDPLGACRMCMVEFPGPRGSRLDTACTVRVSEGMVVRTDTEQVKKVREANLGFILINHPLDCPICDKGGECPLQDQTMEYGPGVSQFVELKRHKQKHYPISDLIMLDQERCILCWRCIRYLEEWEDKPQLGLFERGDETIIDTFPGQPVDAKTSGSIIDICPVGALTNRVSRFRYRPWELKKTPSVCTLCPVGCNLRLDERVHALRRIVARENMAVNDEWICDKGRFLHQYVDHPERLKTPLVREGGELRDRDLGRGAGPDRRGVRARSGVMPAARARSAAWPRRGSATRRPTCSRSSSGRWSAPTTWTSPTARPCGRKPPACPASPTSPRAT